MFCRHLKLSVHSLEHLFHCQISLLSRVLLCLQVLWKPQTWVILSALSLSPFPPNSVFELSHPVPHVQPSAYSHLLSLLEGSFLNTDYNSAQDPSLALLLHQNKAYTCLHGSIPFSSLSCLGLILAYIMYMLWWTLSENWRFIGVLDSESNHSIDYRISFMFCVRVENVRIWIISGQ
jgi:hypothetical protein